MFSPVSSLRWSFGIRRSAGAAERQASRRLEALVDAHLEAIYRTARRLGVRAEDVDDVVQEVLVVLVRRLPDIEVDKERAFAVGTTARVASNWRRRLRRRPQVLTGEIEQASPGGPGILAMPNHVSGEQRVEHAEALELLCEGLEQMTEAQRVTFVLFELEELRASEIATQLDVAEAAVVSRLQRARRVMRRVCARRELGDARARGPAREEIER